MHCSRSHHAGIAAAAYQPVEEGMASRRAALESAPSLRVGGVIRAPLGGPACRPLQYPLQAAIQACPFPSLPHLGRFVAAAELVKKSRNPLSGRSRAESTLAISRNSSTHPSKYLAFSCGVSLFSTAKWCNRLRRPSDHDVG